MDIGILRGAIALITFSTFLGICWWAYRGPNKRRFEEDAWLPFAEDRDRTSARRTQETEHE